MSDKPTYEELEQKIRILENAESERKRAVEALKDTDRKLQQMLNGTRDIIGFQYPDHTIIQFNKIGYKLLDLSPEEVKGKKCYELIGRQKECKVCATRKAIKSKKIETVEKYQKEIKRYLRMTANPVLDEQGEIIYFIEQITDISSRKYAERDLKDSEERFRQLFENMKSGVAVYEATKDGEDFIIRAFNKAAEKIENIKREGILNRPVTLVFPGVKDFGLLNVLQHVWRTGQPEYFEPRIYIDASSSGSWRENYVYKLSSGEIVAIYDDITEQKRIETEILKNAARFKNLAEMLPGAVFETDSEMNITFINQQTYKMFGYSDREFEKGFIATDMIVPEDREKAQKIFIKRIQGEKFGAVEYRGLKKDGTVFPVLLHANPIIEDNKATGLRGILIDITDRKKLEEHLIESQKMESLGALAGGIAHDFNNILSPIIMHSEILMDDLAQDDPLQDDVKEIYKAGERARELVKQILTFARKRSEEKVLMKSSLIVKEAIRFLRSTLPATINIRYENKATQDTILADPTQLNQIVMNLCTNAAHAMREKGGLLQIILNNEEVSVTEKKGLINLRRGPYLRLSVKDNGTGISPAIMDKIFEPYYTTKPPGEGTGLGLAIIHSIVHSHGGDITVKSEVGKGTSFHVYLPLAKTEAAHRKNHGHEAALPKGNERILLVDDERPMVDVISRMLIRLGYQAISMTSSMEAIYEFRNNPDIYDLVISDMTMPNMRGDQLSTEIRKIRKDIPIILCTGFSERINEATANDMDISAFMMKPIVSSELAITIRDVLDK